MSKSRGDSVVSYDFSDDLDYDENGSRPSKSKKLGHRREVDGVTTYKKIESKQIIEFIQEGFQSAAGEYGKLPDVDIIMKDFYMVSTSKKGNIKFKVYAPRAYRFFQEMYGIKLDEFLKSLCSEPLRELSNPGASGSVLFLSHDDQFILKTIQKGEASFLKTLLPGYYMNLSQNKSTLLPKFFGHISMVINSKKEIRLMVMKNVLPTTIQMHQKFDLKGSTYKRKASRVELAKAHPTYKDLDFINLHPDGFYLESETYDGFMKTVNRDCRVLESFRIMDFSLIMGVTYLDRDSGAHQSPNDPQDTTNGHTSGNGKEEPQVPKLLRTRSAQSRSVAQATAALDAIQANTQPIDDMEKMPAGGIPARTGNGERVMLYVGIIDILQSYKIRKKTEHFLKSIIADGDTVSVHRPDFYSNRFVDFLKNKVFKKIPSSLKNSPSKRKGLSKLSKGYDTENGFAHNLSGPPLSSTLPAGTEDSTPKHRYHLGPNAQDHLSSSSDVRLDHKSSALSVESGSSAGFSRGLVWTPPASVEGSTPTWTEGTPSFTESSSSGDFANLSGCQTTPHRSHGRRDSSGPKSQTDDSDHSEVTHL